MRTISGLAALAALAVVAVGVSAGGTPAGAAPATLENESTTYDVVDVITDPDGTTHTRMVRTYEGLPVIGGDSSGIGNHFFYLLAEGSGAKTINGVSHDSPTCNGSTVSGIGRDDAARIWYRALTVYMTSSTDYHGARTASLDAARDLFTAGSVQYNAVTTAWSAVGVS